MNRCHDDGPAPSHPLDAALAFDLLPDAYLILDRQFLILQSNASYRELVGQSAADLLGKSIFDINQFGPREQRDARRSWLSSALADLVPGEPKWSTLFRYETPPRAARSSDEAVAGSEASAPHLAVRYWRVKATLLPSSQDGGAHIVLRVSEVTERVD